MTLKGESKVYKHRKARTLYLTIPAGMACDSQFPFSEGDRVKLIVEDGVLLIHPKSEGTSEGG